jgi:hypothetical protein
MNTDNNHVTGKPKVFETVEMFIKNDQKFLAHESKYTGINTKYEVTATENHVSMRQPSNIPTTSL